MIVCLCALKDEVQWFVFDDRGLNASSQFKSLATFFEVAILKRITFLKEMGNPYRSLSETLYPAVAVTKECVLLANRSLSEQLWWAPFVLLDILLSYVFTWYSPRVKNLATGRALQPLSFLGCFGRGRWYVPQNVRMVALMQNALYLSSPPIA